MSNLIQMNEDLSSNVDRQLIDGMRNAVSGVDITKMIGSGTNMVQPNEGQFQNHAVDPKVEEYKRVYDLAQSGSLVPKETIGNPYFNGSNNTNNDNTNIDGGNVQQDVNQAKTASNQVNQDASWNSWLDEFAGDSVNANTVDNNQLVPEVQNEANVPQSNTNVQSETEIAFKDNLKRILESSAKRGYNDNQRKGLADFAQSLSEDDILNAYEMRASKNRARLQSLIPQKQAPGPTALDAIGGVRNQQNRVNRMQSQPFRLAGSGAKNYDI